MTFNKPFKDLTRFELSLWLASVCAIIISAVLSGNIDWLNTIASLIGVTALIFLAKGYVIGQVLTVIFSVFYGIISFCFRYYGEMITYLFMTTPMAIISIISWVKHPYKETKEVEVNQVTRKQIALMIVLAIITTTAFYFILSALDNANILFSTISITTSFIASYLTFLRSPYYAIGYAANDLVLIVLWSLASLESISYLPMLVCFVMFFFNDIYGFVSWRRMQKRQI
ncbi:MAG: nicotinamide mononucleotide transporter [Lachnospiraceae bacterium]|nr:nicotinamide mononucleotide transporter [Lachnospiraceae bacterium]